MMTSNLLRLLATLLLASFAGAFSSTGPNRLLASSKGSCFVSQPSATHNYGVPRTSSLQFRPSSALGMVPYSPPEDAETTPSTKPKLPLVKIGDVVRYYDVDGGRADGQILVGKIALIQAIRPSSATPPPGADGTNKWLVEINEMEDVGDGYYADYPSRKRRKEALRKLEDIAPLPASFVRSEDAFKVPMERGGTSPQPSHSGFELVAYEGPQALPIDQDVVATDAEKYDKIKFTLIKNAAIAGAAGTIVAELVGGFEDAVIYCAGALAGVAYLFFLGIKTDTVGSEDAKLGSNVSNLRFVLPLLVIVGISLKNTMSGDSNPVLVPGIFSTVTPEQFGSAMIGFLTYRAPLFVSQLAPVMSESVTDMVPGSAGIAMRMAADAKQRGVDVAALDEMAGFDDNLTTVLLVSGPEGTGKTTLVNKLLEDDSRFVKPVLMDRVSEGIKFEQLEQRGSFLEIDSSGRYGLLKEGVLEAAEKAASAEDETSKKVVVVDADVGLAKQLVNVSGARLVGVWIGLDDLEKFESRLKSKIASGGVAVPDGETEDSVLRAKVRQVVKDIEFGVVSGLFEFTILNEDIEESVRQLKEAAGYCFK